jgi:para-nitrobenzyl esterase
MAERGEKERAMSTDHRIRVLFRTLSVGLIVAFAMVAGSVATAAAKNKVVMTHDGRVMGVVTSTMQKFLGIPYAAAPVGNLRWRPPQPPAPWHKPLDTTAFRNHCPQGYSPFGLPSATEDCLFLNVYTPAKIKVRNPQPVMVWFHGGALYLGESDDYDPTKLVVDGGVVVVTVNYRLGMLGFLAHPALSAESPYHGSGDYGFMDQQFALRWVKRNIARFGGDPNNVTIFGQSAGGFSVHSQLVSPTAAGLFHKAIVESGAYSLTQSSLGDAEAKGTAFATLVGCSDQTAACLRSKSASDIVTAWGIAFVYANLDGKVLTQSVGAAFASGRFNRVPVIEGSNHDEWRLFVGLFGEPRSDDQYRTAIAGTLGIPPEDVGPYYDEYPASDYPNPPPYPNPTYALALGALGTDGIFACNAHLSAQRLSAYVPTFEYEFNDANAPQLFLSPTDYPYGAYHAAEIQYLFDVRPAISNPPSLTADQEQLSADMVSYWTTFARSGNPNSSGPPSWPPYETSTDEIQSLVPPTPVTETGSSFDTDHKCAFWAAHGG